MTLANPLLTLAIGIGIGWVVRYAQSLARFGRESVWLDKQALDFKKFAAEQQQTSALLEASEAYNDLELLACLGNGQVTEAKRFMIHKLGVFYQRWTAKPTGEAVPESIQRSLSAIRQAAKDFESVETVLTFRPGNANPTA